MALHEGHLSLIKKSIEKDDVTLCSIHGNPYQFNSLNDFNNYPNCMDSDLKLLENIGCNVVFTPTIEDLYPGGRAITKQHNFAGLDKIMEGKSRPGHFNGVAMVVSRLFSLIEPKRAYFGEKDFQQLIIIQSLVSKCFKKIEIIPCPTLREKNGLAMSSSNLLLNTKSRIAAPRIFQTLLCVKNMQKTKSVLELKKWVVKKFRSDKDLNLEYFEIVDSLSLKKINNWSDSVKPVACIAVYAGKVRLIDNILFRN